MRRYPNPWVFGPATVGLIIAAWLGYFIAKLSGSGPSAAVAFAAVAGLVAAVGVAVVAVLAIRSFDEWKTAQEQGLPAPEVGCEVPPTE
ncbi:MAG: hypothetical protein P1T08_00370 [Acidimicrobiia bacterium]|nr:hypothetical protein [Acidimicrobiia bacterium]